MVTSEENGAGNGRLDHQSAESSPPRNPTGAAPEALNEDQQGMKPGDSETGSANPSQDEADLQQGGEKPPEAEELGRRPAGERDRDYDPDGDRLGI